MLSKKEVIFNVRNLKTPSYLKIESFFTLMNYADQDSLNALYFSLQNDPCELVRHEAAFALGECIADETRKILKEVFQKDSSIVVKHECLMSLGTIGTKEDLEFIKKQITNPLFEVSCSAKIAIDRINQNEDFEHNVKLNTSKYIVKLFDYKNSSQNDRIQILFQLMTIADEKSIDAIGKCLKEDICRIVRHEAAFVLGEIANQKAVEYLIYICKTEKTPIVIHEILFALGTTGNKLAIEFIQNYTNDKNYVISESAKIALDRINLLKKPYKGPEHFKYLN